MNQIVFVLVICVMGLNGSKCVQERNLPSYISSTACWADAQLVRAPASTLIYCEVRAPQPPAPPPEVKQDPPKKEPAP